MSQTKRDVRVGQFWRDTSTRDILRIDKLSLEPISQKVKQPPVWIPPHMETTKDGKLMHVAGRFTEGSWVDGPAEMVPYVRPSIYVRGRYFGMGADMKASHFETERYEYLPKLAAYWVLGSARLRALWK